jgi:hypothetical protein
MSSGRPAFHITDENAREVGRSVLLSDIESPLVRDAVARWNDLRGDRKFPARDEVTPRDIKAFLRNSMLYRIAGDADFEIRVMGDAAVYAYGASYQGMRTSDVNRIHPGMGDVVARVCAAVTTWRNPLAFKGRLSANLCEVLNQEIVFLPLGPTDDLVDHILSVGDYSPRRAPPH